MFGNTSNDIEFIIKKLDTNKFEELQKIMKSGILLNNVSANDDQTTKNKKKLDALERERLCVLDVRSQITKDDFLLQKIKK